MTEDSESKPGTDRRLVDLRGLGGRDTVPTTSARLDLNIGATAPRLPDDWARRIECSLRPYGSEDAHQLRQAIAAAVNRQHRSEVDASNIVLGAGSMALLRAAVEDYVHVDGCVVLSTPGYQGMRRLCQALGARTVLVPRDSNGHLDVAAIVNAIGDSPATLIALNHPVNPTGGTELLTQVTELVQAAPTAGVIVDEAYWEYSGLPSTLDVEQDLTRVIVTRTFSKARGLAGLRLGYAITDAGRVTRWMAQQIPGAISGVTQELALMALEESDRDFGARVRSTIDARERIAQAVHEAWGVTPLPSAANFVFVPLGDGAEARWRLLADQGVFVRLLRNEPGLTDGVRISVGSEDENARLIAALGHAG